MAGSTVVKTVNKTDVNSVDLTVSSRDCCSAGRMGPMTVGSKAETMDSQMAAVMASN